jgi:hypothetical protein
VTVGHAARLMAEHLHADSMQSRGSTARRP